MRSSSGRFVGVSAPVTCVGSPGFDEITGGAGSGTYRLGTGQADFLGGAGFATVIGGSDICNPK